MLTARDATDVKIAPTSQRPINRQKLKMVKSLCHNHLLDFAGVAELADAPDSKSGAPKEREGSTPSSSTIAFQQLA